MKKNSNIVIIILVVCCIATICISAYKQKILKNEISLKDASIDGYSIINMTIAPQYEACIKNIGRTIDEQNIEVRDSLGNPVPLNNLIYDNTLICRFSDYHCESCVKYILYNLLYKSNIDINKVLFIGNTPKNIIFRKLIKDYHLSDYNVVNCPSLGIPVEDLLWPYYMVVDKSLTIKGIYMPNKASYNMNVDSLNLNFLYQYCVENKVSDATDNKEITDIQ